MISQPILLSTLISNMHHIYIDYTQLTLKVPQNVQYQLMYTWTGTPLKHCLSHISQCTHANKQDEIWKCSGHVLCLSPGLSLDVQLEAASRLFTFGRFHLTPDCISSSPRGKWQSTNSPSRPTSPPSGRMSPVRRSDSQLRDCEPSSSSEQTESTSSSSGGSEPSDVRLRDLIMAGPSLLSELTAAAL